MPGNQYTQADMRRFAIATAAYDRKQHPRTWASDDDVLAGLHGHALCFANAHRIQVTISSSDLACGLAAYRRARGLRRPKHLASVALPLLSVIGARRKSAA